MCTDLVWDRRGTAGGSGSDPDYDPLIELLDVFADVKSGPVVVEDRTGWSVEKRLSQRIIDGDRDGLVAELDEALQTISPLDIVNDVLLSGMKVVGERFASGEMQLPFVLQSAETMKAAVGYLEPKMVKTDQAGKGRIVLATVKGDVHDIGKNLVDIILTNNGYEVHNLGIKVGIGDLIDKAIEVDADAIGMSGLLVKSTLIMRDNLDELTRRGLQHTPVLLGGAALTRRYVERDLRERYDGRLFYGKDAFEGLRVMDKLKDLRGSDQDDPEWGRIPTGRSKTERTASRPEGQTSVRRSPTVATDNPVYRPPFTGSRVVRGLPLDGIASYINETALFRNQWQYRPESDERDPEFKDRIRGELRRWLATAKSEGWLVPQVVYGYFPASSDGNDLVIWTDESRSTERLRMSFPRQAQEPYLCIADFFRPIDAQEVDYAAYHIVTMGPQVSERARSLFDDDRYNEYLHVHGLGVEMAEALAEYWHHRIRQEWGFVSEDGPSLGGLFRQKYRGGRYSWGYPACPDLEDNAVLAQLLEADRIGVDCSAETSFQYQPEQTTSALICHHPQAKYFIAR